MISRSLLFTSLKQVAFIAVLSLAPVAAALATAGLRCDQCSMAAARQLAKQAPAGVYFVYSVPDGVVRGFEVEWESGIATAFGHPVPADVQQAVRGMQELFVKSNGTMKDYFVADASGYDVAGLADANAVDFLNDFGLRSRVMDHMADPANMVKLNGITIATRAMVNVAANLPGLSVNAQFTVTLRFNDGTSVRIKIDPGNPGGTYEPGSARTSNGEAIPEANTAEFAGSFEGTHLEMQPIIEQLSRLEVPVVYGPTTGMGGPTQWYYISCVSRGGVIEECTISAQ